MPEYLAPGVFVEEVPHRAAAIEGVSTSSAAFVGATRRGPTQTPKPLTSFADYEAAFGAASTNFPLSVAVQHFFANGGRWAVVVRTPQTGRGKQRCVEAAVLAGDPKARTGIHALAKLPSDAPRVGLLALPDTSAFAPRQHDAAIEPALGFCVERAMFLIVDPPASRARQSALDATLDWARRSKAIGHANGAAYFPRVEMADPSGREGSVLAPASGAVAGVYARTDLKRGVWRAPAGTAARVLGNAGLESDLTDAEVGDLSGVGINALRCLPGRGVLVWGARTLASTLPDTEWKYVNVRRLSLFIERSIDEGLGWAVFEPNGEALWAQVRLAVSSFLNLLWCSGALAGHRTSEAYFVRCGRDTMTRDDVDEGRLIATIGFATLEPAEFVVLRIEQKTADT